MIKVAVLDDYQEVFQQIIDIGKFKGKYEFQIFSEVKCYLIILEHNFETHRSISILILATKLKIMYIIIHILKISMIKILNSLMSRWILRIRI